MSNIQLYNNDCLDILKDIPSEYVDCVITSPPYDELRQYDGIDWNFNKFCNIADEIYRVVKRGGVVVWIVNDETKDGSETGTSFRQAMYFKEIGFNIHDTMIWYKGSCPFPDKTRYYQSFEYMFVFSKGKVKTFNPIKDRKNKWAGTKVHGTLRQSDGSLKTPTGIRVGREVKDYGVRFNLWEQTPERNNNTGHPAVFPIQIANDHILTWSNKGDLVLDPFMGSGTTGLACLNTNRDFIGIEISDKYYNVAKRRIGIMDYEVKNV